MKSLVMPLIDRQQWMAEFSMDRYPEDQQKVLWDLITRAMETQALDTLLDHLNQADQQALIQHLAETDLEEHLETFLTQKIPDHQELLRKSVVKYKEQLQRDMQRAAKKG